VAVPKDEAFRAFLKKEMKTPKRLDSKGRIGLLFAFCVTSGVATGSSLCSVTTY